MQWWRRRQAVIRARQPHVMRTWTARTDVKCRHLHVNAAERPRCSLSSLPINAAALCLPPWQHCVRITWSQVERGFAINRVTRREKIRAEEGPRFSVCEWLLFSFPEGLSPSISPESHSCFISAWTIKTSPLTEPCCVATNNFPPAKVVSMDFEVEKPFCAYQSCHSNSDWPWFKQMQPLGVQPVASSQP